MSSADEEFAWLGDIDAEQILGDARPRTVEDLLKKKKPVWAALYTAWLRRFHPASLGAFELVSKVGGRPRLQERNTYNKNLKVLSADFKGFVDVVGDIKQALDSRTGLARRLGRAADKAASGVKQAAQSDTATQVAGRLAGPSATRVVGTAAGGSTQRPTQQPQQPQRSPAQVAPPVPPRPDPRLGAYANQTATAALALAADANLDSYVQWLDWVRQLWYPLGGSFGAHTPYLYTLHDEIVRYRAAIEQAATAVHQRSPGADDRRVVRLVYEVRRPVHTLANYVDLVYYLLGLPAPHLAITEVHDELVEQQAYLLHQAVRPRLHELAESLMNMYSHGVAVVRAEMQLIGTQDPAYGDDKLQPWQEHLTAYYYEAAALKDKLAVAVDIGAAEEPEKGENELSRRLFGVPVSELPAYG